MTTRSNTTFCRLVVSLLACLGALIHSECLLLLLISNNYFITASPATSVLAMDDHVDIFQDPADSEIENENPNIA